MRVGFLNNQIDNRGTGNAVFDYAHYNETLLGNESLIFTRSFNQKDVNMEKRLIQRFGDIRDIEITRPGLLFSLDVLYHIKYGYDDGFTTPKGIRYAVHGVFDNSPHGDRYAVISRWLAGEYGVYVPHIVSLPAITENLRGNLGIPEQACVFGRHGGSDTFDIVFAWSSIRTILAWQPLAWFVFMNTEGIPEDILNHERVVVLPPTADPTKKRKFINTCNAMIHARSRGETFGISVGEFAICGKPVITYSESPERAHIEELGNFAYLYKNEEELTQQMLSLIEKPALSWGYGQYTPELVMKKFEEVFLS